MPGTATGQTLFDLSGGHPALDLVNSLDNRFRDDGPNEILVGYGELLRFLGESGLLDTRQVRLLGKGGAGEAAAQTLRAVRDLREAAAGVFYAALEPQQAPSPADLKTLERHIIEASQHRQLRWRAPGAQGHQQGHASSSSGPASIRWQWADSGADPNLALWALSQSVSDLLLSEDMMRIRTCAVDTCRWLFLDTSKNHTRRWCNMRVCGNRMKARRFQARRES
jgi:predicted RNA-binding Zn ribbon-like protein